MDFGNILRELLNDHDITQKQFAEDLSIAASTLGNYIRDNREPDFETLIKIANYFKVSIDYLLNHQVEQTSNHQEDHLLHVFRALPENQRMIYLAQGKVMLQHTQKNDEVDLSV